MVKPWAPPEGVEKFELEGHVVELRRVPPRRWSWDYRHESQKREGEPEGAPRDQRRYAIWIGNYILYSLGVFG